MYTSTANGILAVSIVFPLLAALFVALRFAARRLKSISPQADDWTTVISLVSRSVPDREKLNLFIRMLGFLFCPGHQYNCWSRYWRTWYATRRTYPDQGRYIIEGGHFLVLEAKMLTYITKIVYADSFLCFTSEAIVKIAILLFYKRIFITKSFTITANAMMIAVVVWHVSSILVSLHRRNPIKEC